MKTRTAEEKIALIKDVADRFYVHTETFNEPWGGGNLGDATPGATLAYLLSAIADGDQMTVFPEFEEHTFLKTFFPDDHAVWDYIEIEKENT